MKLSVHKWDNQGRQCELRYKNDQGVISQFCGYLDYEKGELLARLWNMNQTNPEILQEHERIANGKY